MRWTLAAILAASLTTPTLAAERVTIVADRDGTLIEHPSGALANGAGTGVFVGRTGQPKNSIRRGLVRFDVAGALPPGAVIEAVRLIVNVAQTNRRSGFVRVQRVASDWGEGASASGGGGGAPAAPGDATWRHAFYPGQPWKVAGGHFVQRVSSVQKVSTPGRHVWEGAELANDVRYWQAAPERNFGWVLIGDETGSSTASRIDSREHVFADRRPQLEVLYKVVRP